ncbi:hypothetical protein [Cytophaga aurantiaca]|uniref:hypothetical protein n=1 Tax=Cytophaga aurantiaca TaxID=29530 RepID=UPI0003A17D11|nr:hypothetical protein [Cytophaga aurantiaca]
MKEYRIAKGWTIFMYIMSPVIIALFGWFLFLPLLDESMGLEVLWFSVPISLTMITVVVLGLIDTIKGKFVIDTDRIYTTNVFNKRMLLFNEIKGFRVEDKYIFVESAVKNKKRIKISTYYGKCDEIKDWLYQHYDDLAIVNILAEEKVILQDVEFGRSVEERESRLLKARKICMVLTIASIVVGLWAFIWPYPYGIVMTALVAFPLIAILLVKTSNGLIRLEDKKDSAYPSVMLSIAIPGFMLLFRSLLDYNLLDYSNTFLPAILTAIFLSAIGYVGNKEFSAEKVSGYLSTIGIAVFIFCASYGGLIFLNCYYDQSAEQIFPAQVLSKRESSGKHTSYYVELAAWGEQKEAEEVSISSDLYEQFEKGDIALVYLRKGLFDIPWFEVDKKH